MYLFKPARRISSSVADTEGFNVPLGVDVAYSSIQHLT